MQFTIPFGGDGERLPAQIDIPYLPPPPPLPPPTTISFAGTVHTCLPATDLIYACLPPSHLPPYLPFCWGQDLGGWVGGCLPAPAGTPACLGGAGVGWILMGEEGKEEEF